MLALIGNVARGVSTVRSATKMLPKGKKGGALVPSQRPGLSQFYDQARQKKAAAAPTLDRSSFFSAPKIGDAKKGSTNVESAENKISLITNFIRKGNQKRRESFKSYLNTKQDKKRKEKEEKKENFAKGLVKGVGSRALAPVKSIFDRILDAVGKIVIAKIGMWAIDNPKAFTAIIKGIDATLTVITDIFIGTIDFLSTIIFHGYKLVDGFNDWSKDNLGEEATKTLTDIGPKIAALLGGVLLLGKAMEGQALSELGRKDPASKPGGGRKPNKPAKPGKLGGGKERTLSGRTRSTATVKPQRSPVQQTRIGSPERRLARNVQVKHGHAAREVYEEAFDEARGKGKSAFEANKTAKTKVDRLIRKNPQISKPQLGSLSARANRIRGTVGGPGASNLIGSKVFGKGVDRATQRFFLKIIGKGGVTAVKKVMGKIPIIGPLLVFGLNWASGESIARSASMAVGSGLGQMLGTWAGGALGALGGPLAPVTIPLGGFLGAMLGGIGGEFLGGLFYDAISGKLGGSPGAVGSALGKMVGVLFTQQIPEMLKGFTEWFSSTMKSLGTGFLNIINASAEFLGLDNLADVFKNTVGKAFSAIGNFFKMIQEIGFPPLNPIQFAMWVAGNLGKLKDGLFSLFGGMKDFAAMLVNPIGFIFKNAIMPFFKNLGEMWANRDKLFDFLTRENTFSEVTGTISSLGESASSSLAAGASSAVSATTGATTTTGDPGGAVSATVAGSEMDLFKRLVLAESGGEGELGMALVARSVMNRAGLIQSGKVGPGMFMANDKSITGVIMGRGQYQPVSDGSINTQRSDAQMAKAAAAIKLAKNVDQLKAKLKAAGMSADEINKLVASTGFRTGSAFNDPSQNVNVVKFKNHFFNTAGNAGLTATSARISTEDNAQQAQIPTNPTPSSPSAAAVSTLSRGSGGSGAGGPSGGGKAQVGDQAIVPIPIPSQQAVPSGGTFSTGGSTSLNSLYMAQLFGFLYKQG